MKNILFYLSGVLLLLPGCIGDDVIFDTVAESVRITNPIDTLGLEDTYTFQAQFLNNIGEEEPAEIFWSSSDTSILTIDPDGLALGKAPGDAMVEAEVEIPGKDPVMDQILVHVAEGETGSSPTERLGELRTTSSYTLEGSFVLREEGNGLVLRLNDDYQASSSLPGLYVYLTNNPNTSNNALEISKVTIFSGAHSYPVPGNVDLNTYQYVLYYCKPFNVKVGDGEFMD